MQFVCSFNLESHTIRSDHRSLPFLHLLPDPPTSPPIHVCSFLVSLENKQAKKKKQNKKLKKHTERHMLNKQKGVWFPTGEQWIKLKDTSGNKTSDIKTCSNSTRCSGRNLNISVDLEAVFKVCEREVASSLSQSVPLPSLTPAFLGTSSVLQTRQHCG